MKEKNKITSKIKCPRKIRWRQKRIDTQHDQGKATAREAAFIFVGPTVSFEEVSALVPIEPMILVWANHIFYGDGVVTGYGTINGRQVWVFAQAVFTVFGRLPFLETHAEKLQVMDMAI